MRCSRLATLACISTWDWVIAPAPVHPRREKVKFAWDEGPGCARENAVCYIACREHVKCTRVANERRNLALASSKDRDSR